MNYAMVGRLIKKEWQFNAGFVGALLGGGILILIAFVATATILDGWQSMIPLILFYIVINGLMWLPVLTVTSERSEQTLAFLVSLPITIREYSGAKLISNMVLFGVAWMILSAGVIGLNVIDQDMPNIYIGVTLIVHLQAFLMFSAILAVALISESVPVTMATGVIGNVVFWLSFGFIGVFPGMGVIPDPQASWDAVSWMLPLQLIALPLLLILTIVIQGRKTDFV